MLTLLNSSDINEMPVFKPKKPGTTFMTHVPAEIKVR